MCSPNGFRRQRRKQVLSCWMERRENRATQLKLDTLRASPGLPRCPELPLSCDLQEKWLEGWEGRGSTEQVSVLYGNHEAQCH